MLALDVLNLGNLSICVLMILSPIDVPLIVIVDILPGASLCFLTNNVVSIQNTILELADAFFLIILEASDAGEEIVLEEAEVVVNIC